MEGIAIVRSSNGDIFIDFETGQVKHIDLFEGGELPPITLFELPKDDKASEYDIIELGYWLEDGNYEPPDESMIKARSRDRKIDAVLKCLDASATIFVEGFFDCGCEKDYFRFFKSTAETVGDEVICKKCGAVYDDVPSSRLNEMVAELLKGE